MNILKRSLLSLFLATLIVAGMTTTSQAVEMEVDVGIEFTEIEPEPTPDPKPVPTPKPPIQKIIQLPQTGEKSSQGFTIAGAILMVGAGVIVYKRKSGVTKE